ncbi:MAG: hypothetical protein KGR26_13115 [Cyanobacteria bacterium REEB65]|nr:hypothetical protein [Cyanobacteria bacterium REEB65]
MILAILHLSVDTPASQARQEYLSGKDHGVYHTHLNKAAAGVLREFPPDVAIVELGDRAVDALAAVQALLEVPRRRGDALPMVLAEVRPEDVAAARAIAPHAILLQPGASPQDAEAACEQAFSALLA